jgi:Fe2+ or Zn2+ uptake regulation protein
VPVPPPPVLPGLDRQEDFSVRAVLSLLRDRGCRVTVPRRLMVEALVMSVELLTAEELVARITDRAPEVHASTVYRTLETLERLGVVEHTHLGHGPARWHLSTAERHHLVCDGCGTVMEVPAPIFAAACAEVEGAYGFRVNLRHFALSGFCAACRSA